MNFSQTSRRQFLRGGGAAMALPFLEITGMAASAPSPRRMVSVANPLGMLPDGFFPEKAGALEHLPFLLKPLESHRKDFTVFSHLDHGVSGGHIGCHSFLTGMRDVEAVQFPDRNISIDQRAAEHVGADTRFPSMTLSAGRVASGEQELRLSWTRNGINIPPVQTSRDLFNALFHADDPAAQKNRAEGIKRSHSILDAVSEHAKLFTRDLGREDKEKMDEYFTSVRTVEKRLEMSEKWISQPKPKPGIPMPKDQSIVETLPAFFDLIALALQTDSSRVITLGIPSTLRTADLDLAGSYHGFSHHGQAEVLRKGLSIIEGFQMKELSRFLTKLKTLKDSAGALLLDNTTVLFGSGLGNGSSHSNKDLPVLVAGGGWKSHGTHVVSPKESSRRVPLTNLYTTLLQDFGVETDGFSKSNGTMNELVG